LEMQLGRIPGRGGLAGAIQYALTRWPALCRFLDDGRIELDNNSVERAIRPIALGRKNHLFAGSDGGAERWATVCSLIASAKLNDVEPFTYLKDILKRMTEDHRMSRLDDLLPWNWPKVRVNARAASRSMARPMPFAWDSLRQPQRAADLHLEASSAMDR